MLCVEGLSFLIRQSIEERVLASFVCSNGRSVVSHLFFTDDSKFFYKTSVGDYLEVRRLLGCYVAASSQKINMEKSTMIFSPNVLPGIRVDILACLGMASSYSYYKYLGLLTLIGQNK